MKKYIINIFKNPLFSGSMIMLFGNMFANAINYVYHILMGRMLGPVNYGILASIYSILYLISIIPASTSVAIVKFISSATNEIQTYVIYKSLERFVFKFALVVSVSIFLFSPIISNFLKINNFWAVSLVAPVLFFSLITLVNQSVSLGLTKFFGSVGPNIISSVVKLALGVFLVLIGWSVFGAMVGVVAALISAYLYSYWFLKRYLKKTKITKFDLKPFFKYTFPVLIQALAFTSLFTTDVILVKHFLSALDAGLYAAISTLGKIIFFATSPISGAMFPIISKKYTAMESYKNVFSLGFLATFLISGAVVCLYWIFPSIAVGILYGNAYLSVSGDLVWMGLFILFYSLSSFVVNFFLSIGKVRVVWLPLLFSVLQVSTIWFIHGSILQVLLVSLISTFLLFICLVFSLWYNRHEWNL